MAPVFGSRQGLVPCARATKLATVPGVSLSYNRAVMAPSLVVKIAYNPGFKAGGFGAALSGMKANTENVSAIKRVAYERRPITCPWIGSFHCNTNGHRSSREGTKSPIGSAGVSCYL
jgi:hypothetical protein